MMKGARCPECGNCAVIKKEGCEFCSACGYVWGGCGLGLKGNGTLFIKPN